LLFGTLPRCLCALGTGFPHRPHRLGLSFESLARDPVSASTARHFGSEGTTRRLGYRDAPGTFCPPAWEDVVGVEEPGVGALAGGAGGVGAAIGCGFAASAGRGAVLTAGGFRCNSIVLPVPT